MLILSTKCCFLSYSMKNSDISFLISSIQKRTLLCIILLCKILFTLLYIITYLSNLLYFSETTEYIYLPFCNNLNILDHIVLTTISLPSFLEQLILFQKQIIFYCSSPKSAIYASISFSGQSETASSLPVKKRSVFGSCTNLKPPIKCL